MAIEQFEFTDAERDEVRLLIGLFGMTGGGKTKSALRMALGIQDYLCELNGDAGPIVLIDTENGRAKLYAPQPGQDPEPPETFAFKHLFLTPEFSPGRYKGALEAASMLGPSVVIIDSMTHEWTGAGGMLQRVEESENKHKGAAWNEPKRAHRQLMSVLEHRQYPLILCYRAKEKYKITKGDMIPLGVRAISETELPYQMTFSFLLGDDEPGQVSLDRKLSDHIKTYDTAAGVVEDGEMATEELGRRLMAWSLGNPWKEHEE